jgi:DNA-binding transcriptional LysR family regulator
VDRSYGARVVQAVIENQADFGITQLPVKEKRLQVAKIYTDELKLIVAEDHPLAGKQSVQAQDLIGVPLLLPRAGRTRSRLNAWLELIEGDTNVSMELDSTEMMKRFVRAGLGVAFLAESYCREEIAAGHLKAASLGPEPMARWLGLIYRKDKALSKAALGFIQVILDQTENGVNGGGGGATSRFAKAERPEQ